MKKPLISILMPAYNAVSFIEESLESVKNQTYTDWELIVIEDGSDDGTKVIVDKFKTDVNQQVVYHRNKVNKGLPATRNVAASIARGDWYALLDSDDIWHKDHLLSLITTSEKNTNCDLIYSSHYCFSETVQQLVKDNNTKKKAENIPTSIIKGYIIQPSGILVSSKSFLSVGGFDESFRYVEDINFWFKLLKQGYTFKLANDITLYYRQNPDGLSRNQFKMSYYLAKAFDQAIDWDAIPKKLRYSQISKKWIIAARTLRKNENKLAKIAIKKAVKYNLSIYTLFYLVLIYFTGLKTSKK